MVDTKETKGAKKPIQTDQLRELDQEQRSKQRTMKGKEIQSKQPQEENQENGPKQAKRRVGKESRSLVTLC